MLTLAFIKQVYTKTKPNLNAFNELFLELEAVSGHQNNTEQLLFTTPLGKHQNLVYLAFDPENKDFYYDVYSIK